MCTKRSDMYHWNGKVCILAKLLSLTFMFKTMDISDIFQDPSVPSWSHPNKFNFGPGVWFLMVCAGTRQCIHLNHLSCKVGIVKVVSYFRWKQLRPLICTPAWTCQSNGRIFNILSGDISRLYFYRDVYTMITSPCSSGKLTVEFRYRNIILIKWTHFPSYWLFVRAIHRWLETPWTIMWRNCSVRA